MADSLRPVNVGACRCPGAPHADGDVVSLDAELSTPAGIAATAVTQSASGHRIEDISADITMALVRHSVREWTLRDENGPVPITPENIHKHLPWMRGGKEVADAAVSLYTETLTGPLGAASRRRKKSRTPTETSLESGSTDTDSTSPTPLSPRKRRSA